DRVNPIFVQGNWIGVNRTGAPLGNGASGIVLHTTSDVTIGGAAAGAGNVIAANGDDGVFDEGGHRNTIQGNLIGILPDGVIAARTSPCSAPPSPTARRRPRSAARWTATPARRSPSSFSPAPPPARRRRARSSDRPPWSPAPAAPARSPPRCRIPRPPAGRSR